MDGAIEKGFFMASFSVKLWYFCEDKAEKRDKNGQNSWDSLENPCNF